MSSISIVGLTPPPRYPPVSTHWTMARIEEAPSDAGPWTIIEDTFALSPIPDLLDPQTYEFTTNNATLDQGWYRVVWLDVNGITDTTLPVFNDTQLDAYRPTVAMLGTLMRARTRVRGGSELGTFRDGDSFTPPTRPTAAEVEGIIDDLMPMVEADLGEVPDGLLPQARMAATYKVAQAIEMAYWPEQNDTDQSLAVQYGLLYTAAVASLLKRIEGDTPGLTFGIGSVPIRGLTGLPAVLTVSATLTAGEQTVTVDSTRQLAANWLVSGPGVPALAYVLSVDSETQFTMSKSATASGLAVLTLTAA